MRVLIEYGLKVCIFTEINDLFSTGSSKQILLL